MSDVSLAAYWVSVILLWSPYLIGQTIIFFPVISIFFSFFPRLISAVGDWIIPYFHTWCGLSANLRCRSETCCTRLARNTGRKKVAKNRHLGTIAQLCRAISSQLRHISAIGKKFVKQKYVLHMSPQYGELRPTSITIVSRWINWCCYWRCCRFEGRRFFANSIYVFYKVAVICGNCHNQQLTSCRWQTRATRCITANVLQTSVINLCPS